jgi:hypothetical protein
LRYPSDLAERGYAILAILVIVAPAEAARDRVVADGAVCYPRIAAVRKFKPPTVSGIEMT